MIVIIDYDTGNLVSLENAIQRCGFDVIISADPEKIKIADKVILPGVGSADIAMQKLTERGLPEIIRSLKVPTLGICVGMQLMCKNSEEGNCQCIAIFDTHVKLIKSTTDTKVPHMGWNNCYNLSSKLFEGVTDNEYIYFVHSYASEISEKESIATCNYGVEFSAALQKDNFYGVQFHPEKSGSVGEKILRNFFNLK